ELQIQENKYKNQVKEIVGNSKMALDDLQEKYDAAIAKNAELISEQKKQEQELNEEAQKLKSQLEPPTIQSTDDTNARKLAEYDQIIKETKDKDAKIEAYELKIFTFHKQSSAKSHKINALEREKAQLQIEHDSRGRQIEQFKNKQIELRQKIEGEEKKNETLRQT
ncbi:15372_t:CDS:2, partial [Racocetra fulgida]